MATITPVTGDTEADTTDTLDDGDVSAPRHADSARDSDRRSPVIGAQATVIAALIGGMFLLAVVGFNTLRSDITTHVGLLRSDMNARFALVDQRFTQIDQRFTQIDQRFAQIDERFNQIEARFVQIEAQLGAINQTLFDHTDRLARIETAHDIHPHPRAPQSDAQP